MNTPFEEKKSELPATIKNVTMAAKNLRSEVPLLAPASQTVSFDADIGIDGFGHKKTRAVNRSGCHDLLGKSNEILQGRHRSTPKKPLGEPENSDFADFEKIERGVNHNHSGWESSLTRRHGVASSFGRVE